MAKSNLKIQQEKAAERAAEIADSLREGTARAKASQAESLITTQKIIDTVQMFGDSLGATPVRHISTFNRAFKTQDVGKITLAVVTHLYGKFRAPSYLAYGFNFLVKQYLNPVKHAEPVNRRNRYAATPEPAYRDVETMCEWWILVASGGSLWKLRTRQAPDPKNISGPQLQFLTRQENHEFLNCPIKDVSYQEAIIYAIAKGHTNDLGILSRVCRTKMAKVTATSVLTLFTSQLFRQIIQLFATNELTFSEMNDLMDYFLHELNESKDYNLKGRTLASLKKNMSDWHWALARVKRMGNANWKDKAVDIEDTVYQIPQTPGVNWHMRQITSSKDLCKEGTEMRHCVYGYQSQCVSGKTAIWSLGKSTKNEFAVDRALTIEMDVVNDNLVQIRGLANRAPRTEEMTAVRAWCGKYGVRISARLY